VGKLKAAAPNEHILKAWLYGDWNIVAGSMFGDVWDDKVHVLPSIPWAFVPEGWRVDRSYDHGQSKPFSVGWWAESNGEPILYKGRYYGTVPGDLIRMDEWYGWNGEPNTGVRMLASDIAEGILYREDEWEIEDRVHVGVADGSIFDDFEPGKSVAGDMEAEGVEWEAADKRPGSRKHGWEQMRKLFKHAIPEGGPREYPGLFVTERCTQFIRTVPVLPRDEVKVDDVDTDSEDHIADEVRYKCRSRELVTECRDW
jgi:hypothetical protein